VRRVPVAHGATEKKSPAAARYCGTKIPVPSCGIRGVPLFGRNAMKANLLDNVLAFTCIAAFITGITIAAVTLFGYGGRPWRSPRPVRTRWTDRGRSLLLLACREGGPDRV